MTISAVLAVWAPLPGRIPSEQASKRIKALYPSPNFPGSYDDVLWKAETKPTFDGSERMVRRATMRRLAMILATLRLSRWLSEGTAFSLTMLRQDDRAPRWTQVEGDQGDRSTFSMVTLPALTSEEWYKGKRHDGSIVTSAMHDAPDPVSDHLDLDGHGS